MRNPERVEVTEGILHLVGEGTGRDTTLSDELLTLSSDAATRNFIESHILNSLAAEQAMTAKWSDPKMGVAAACASLFHQDADLISASHQITDILGGIVRGDGRISAAGVLVARFTIAGDAYPNHGPAHVAILKLDPSDGFVQVKEKSKGRVQVSLKKVDHVVPSSREKLQKCAFVCHPANRVGLQSGCDLLVLDRQQRGESPPSDFFLFDFLGALRATDDESLTRTFNRITTASIHALSQRKLIDDEVRNDLFAHRLAALRSQRLSVKKFVNNLPVSREAKQVIRERFSEMADTTFRPDEKTAIHLTRKTIYRGDHGLQIAVDTGHADQVVESAEHVSEDVERGPHWKVTIRTRDWHQVQSR